jgi:Lrp/AsnC family transcriptional regulator of ectoine degradation
MTTTKLDPIDLRILNAVQRDGRITKAELAEQVGQSQALCWTRLRKLEEAGVVTGYHAKVATRQLAPVATVLMEVTLSAHRQADFERFEHAVGDIPEIVACWSVGGGVDYMLKIMARDIDAYQRLVDDLLGRELGIDRYFTYIVIKTIKDADVLPLDELVAGDFGA